jgi:hypothetical protein
MMVPGKQNFSFGPQASLFSQNICIAQDINAQAFLFSASTAGGVYFLEKPNKHLFFSFNRKELEIPRKFYI